MKSIRIWLWGGWALVICMFIIGGITRLTGSGLSIVHWKPVSGIIPPTTKGEWEEEFSAYKNTPEYVKVNNSISLTEFKKIFFWEYLHRLLGRFTGLYFLSGLILFRKENYGRYYKDIIVLIVLVTIQGLIGWLMVKSGLQDKPHVSHYRLALHLGTAFILGLLLCRTYNKTRNRYSLTYTLPLLIFIQVILGALVAGLKAGFSANTWPLMDGSFFPQGQTIDTIIHFTEQGLLVQFMHRWFPLIILLFLTLIWYRNRSNSVITGQLAILAFLILLQFSLGVTILIFKIPIIPSVIHQVFAFIIFSYAALITGPLKQTGIPVREIIERQTTAQYF